MNTTSKSATITANQTIHSAINQICNQKFKMTVDEKKCVSDFIASKVSDKVKVEFVRCVPDGCAQIKIRQEDMTIIVAYSHDSADTIYVMTTVNKVPEKVSVKQPELSRGDRYRIIKKTTEYVDAMIWNKVCLDIKENGQQVVSDFLKKQIIKGRIKALPCAVFPKGISAQETASFGYYGMELAFAENKINPKQYSHVLWVRITRDESVKERENKEAREENFRKFWKSNKLPDSLLGDVISMIDVTKTYMVLVHKNAKRWVAARMQESDAVKYFGQLPYSGNGGVVPNKPIGYVAGGKIVIVDPAAKFEFRAYEFI